MNSFKHRHVAYQNDRIEMLITDLKIVLKNIDSVWNDFQITYQNEHFWLNQLFLVTYRTRSNIFQNGFQIRNQHFNAVILICNMHVFKGIKIFGFIRGWALFIPPRAPAAIRVKSLLKLEWGLSYRYMASTTYVHSKI